jgi:hypothetical protein
VPAVESKLPLKAIDAPACPRLRTTMRSLTRRDRRFGLLIGRNPSGIKTIRGSFADMAGRSLGVYIAEG